MEKSIRDTYVLLAGVAILAAMSSSAWARHNHKPNPCMKACKTACESANQTGKDAWECTKQCVPQAKKGASTFTFNGANVDISGAGSACQSSAGSGSSSAPSGG